MAVSVIIEKFIIVVQMHIIPELNNKNCRYELQCLKFSGCMVP